MDIDEIERHRRTVTTRYGVTSYLDVGAGPPALFVHGLATSAYLWRNVIGRLADQRRCLAIDLPLHGRTPGAAAQDFSLPGLAGFVEDFCAALELPAVELVAHDSGGAIVQVFAALHPDRVATLTLTNGDTHDNLPPRAFAPTVLLPRLGLFAPLARRLLRDPARARRRVYASGFEDVASLPENVVVAYLTPLCGTAENARQSQRLIRSLHKRDLLAVEDRLGRLTAPTLIVWGTGDRFFETKWAYWLRDTIPGAQTVIELPGARLFFPDERANELATAIIRHWATAPRQQAAAQQ
jgi:pimeloyl-ACP methyl ester carboxylesterase